MKIILDEIITKKKLTYRQVSNLTGISKSTIERIVNHDVSPRMDVMERLATGLHVYIEDLYESPKKKCPITGTNH